MKSDGKLLSRFRKKVADETNKSKELAISQCNKSVRIQIMIWWNTLVILTISFWIKNSRNSFLATVYYILCLFVLKNTEVERIRMGTVLHVCMVEELALLCNKLECFIRAFSLKHQGWKSSNEKQRQTLKSLPKKELAQTFFLLLSKWEKWIKRVGRNIKSCKTFFEVIS
jgi:hypothetical protein